MKTYDTIVLNWSIRGAWGIDLRGYLGSRERRRVLGRWKETDVRTLRAEWECAPWRAAFFAALALLSFPDGAAKQLKFSKKHNYKNARTLGCSLTLGSFCGDHYCCSRVWIQASQFLNQNWVRKTKSRIPLKSIHPTDLAPIHRLRACFNLSNPSPPTTVILDTPKHQKIFKDLTLTRDTRRLRLASVDSVRARLIAGIRHDIQSDNKSQTSHNGGLGKGARWRCLGREMKIININNREKKKGKERRKKITDLFSVVCELKWGWIRSVWLRNVVAARRQREYFTSGWIRTHSHSNQYMY